MADRWRGCPERNCKRHRLCTTPRGFCPNAPTPAPLDARQRARLELHYRINFGHAAVSAVRTV